jgi:hypothetical protein
VKGAYKGLIGLVDQDSESGFGSSSLKVGASIFRYWFNKTKSCRDEHCRGIDLSDVTNVMRNVCVDETLLDDEPCAFSSADDTFY